MTFDGLYLLPQNDGRFLAAQTFDMNEQHGDALILRQLVEGTDDFVRARLSGGCPYLVVRGRLVCRVSEPQCVYRLEHAYDNRNIGGGRMGVPNRAFACALNDLFCSIAIARNSHRKSPHSG